ncbi:hypothetical protein [Roseivirga pacifica]|uniref:hypothetical protein n=1 Tax=Roseivirga pacifica TaxID=1267423 RepID=UPI003BAEDA07
MVQSVGDSFGHSFAIMAYEFPQNDGVSGLSRFSDFELRTMNYEQQNCFLINGYTDN